MRFPPCTAQAAEIACLPKIFVMMIQLTSKYVYPFSDYSFKKLFGRQASKKILIDFLNALIKPEKPIVNINYLNTEALGRTKHDRKSVFDIYCETENGDRFIIEIQRACKAYLLDRIIYYSTFPIQDRNEKGDWNFNIKKTYTVCLLDDCFDQEHPDQFMHTFKIVDIENKTELEHLAIYNIELPKFRKTEAQLNSRLDTWLYVLNNLTSFADIPFFLREDEIFKDFFMNAELANFHREQYMAYVASMIETWDQNAWRATVEEKKEEIALKDEELMRMNEEITLMNEEITVKNEEIIRKDKALEEAKQEIKLMVKTMARNGIDIQIIHECTRLDLGKIRSLIED